MLLELFRFSRKHQHIIIVFLFDFFFEFYQLYFEDEDPIIFYDSQAKITQFIDNQYDIMVSLQTDFPALSHSLLSMVAKFHVIFSLE